MHYALRKRILVTVDPTMPLRMLHYVACFYQHLLKTKVTTPAQGLPPILPIVLYNGFERWSAAEDIIDHIRPEPPQFLRAYRIRLDRPSEASDDLNRLLDEPGEVG